MRTRGFLAQSNQRYDKTYGPSESHLMAWVWVHTVHKYIDSKTLYSDKSLQDRTTPSCFHQDWHTALGKLKETTAVCVATIPGHCRERSEKVVTRFRTEGILLNCWGSSEAQLHAAWYLQVKRQTVPGRWKQLDRSPWWEERVNAGNGESNAALLERNEEWEGKHLQSNRVDCFLTRCKLHFYG